MSDGLTGGMCSSWLVLLRDLSAKSALLLLAAWVLTLTMRRTSAAARHLVWLLTFAGLLLLPLLSVTLPARSVPILPARFVPVLPPTAVPVVLSLPATPSVATEAQPNAVPDRLPAAPPSTRALPATTPPPGRPDLPLLLCLLWLLGVALASSPLLAGWLLAARRIRRCSPVADLATLALAAEAGHHLGLRRPVILRSGPSVSMPVTFGLLRPVILLPDGAASWPAERLRVALLHEMAHVRRGDWATQTAARLACALFWHNPLVWPAARMLRAEAERACDDLVLSSGIPAPDYAQHLLAVAAALAGADRPLPMAVPMAGRGPLESRLRAVLTTRPRRAPSRRLIALAFFTALAVLVPLAVLRPAARAARQTVRHAGLAAVSLPPAILSSSPPVVVPFLTPKAVRPSPSPLLPVLPIASHPTLKGVPPMKPLMPVKIAALAAFAAGLALPAIQAQPTASVKHAPVPKLAYMPTSAEIQILLAQAQLRQMNVYKKAYPAAPADALHWMSISVPQVALKTIMALTPWAQGKNPNGVKYMFFLLGNNSILVNATPAGLAEVQRQVKMIAGQLQDAVNPRQEVLKALDDVAKATAAPRQVQIKFEWVFSASASGAAPDKNVEALTIIAEEGRMTQASSRHMRDGAGGEETINVLAHLKPGGVVTLDITEHSTMTAKLAGAVSSVNQTTLSFKDGETRSISSSLLGSKQVGQSMERMLFVTPTIIQPSADGSTGTRSAPLQDGDIINVNPFTAPHSEDTSESDLDRAISVLLVERANKLAGGATPSNPDVVKIDTAISMLQRRKMHRMMPMTRKRVNPTPDKAP